MHKTTILSNFKLHRYF